VVSALVGLAAGGVAFGLAGGVAAADAGWTITYRSVGAPCTSRPDMASLTVSPGAMITVVNQTGGSAILDTDQRRQQTLVDGDAVRLQLNTGEHAVRLLPDCVATGEVDAVTIFVAKGAKVESSGVSWTEPVTPAPPGGPADLPIAVQPVVGAPGPRAREGDEPQPIQTDASTGPPVLGGGPASTDIEPSTPDDLAIGVPFPFTGQGDKRGVQLVGVVALICIFGVSVGIIRVIRTSPERTR
jgi:hypothetical protein